MVDGRGKSSVSLSRSSVFHQISTLTLCCCTFSISVLSPLSLSPLPLSFFMPKAKMALIKFLVCFSLPPLSLSLSSACCCCCADYRSSRAISLRPERSLSQGFTSLELDTVLEERCSDIEQTQTEILNPESPMDTNSSYKMSFSSS